MRRKCLYIRIVALMLLMASFCNLTAYAKENDVATSRVDGPVIAVETYEDSGSVIVDDTYEEDLQGIVLDASGRLWHMPEQIPLTFLTQEEEEFIFGHQAYTETTQTLEDTRDNSQILWDYWYYKVGNAKGVAGLMGNICAESGFNPQNLQGSYESRLKMNDSAYTKAVDDGTYKNFVKDRAGYGLAQWTYWSLKDRLLKYAQKTGQSIGDIYMQVDFLYLDITERYPDCAKVIANAKTVKQSSDYILINFERPADQSEAAQNRRANYGQTCYYNCIGRCDMIDAMKDSIALQLRQAQSRSVLLDMDNNITSLWSDFLSGFCSESKAMPDNMLSGAWDDLLKQ